MNTYALLAVLCAVLLVIALILAGSMNHFALFFMLGAWLVVLGILIWSFSRLLKQPPPGQNAQPPDDGTP